jgi:hypothetical protein
MAMPCTSRHHVEVVVVLLLEALDDVAALEGRIVRVVVADVLDVLGAGGAHRRRHAGGGRVVGVVVDRQARILARLDQQRRSLPQLPVITVSAPTP